MRCNICNKVIEPTQIKQDKRGEWMPCGTCVSAAWVDLGEGNNLNLSDGDMEFFVADVDAVGLVGKADD